LSLAPASVRWIFKHRNKKAKGNPVGKKQSTTGSKKSARVSTDRTDTLPMSNDKIPKAGVPKFSIWKRWKAEHVARTIDLTKESSIAEDRHFPRKDGRGSLDVLIHIRAYSTDLTELFAKIQQFRNMSQDDQQAIRAPSRIAIAPRRTQFVQTAPGSISKPTKVFDREN
jgi:hypothetical protein